MLLGTQQHNRCKKEEQDADDSSCAHREINCRMNDRRATPNAFEADLELDRQFVCSHRPAGLRFDARLFVKGMRFAAAFAASACQAASDC